MSQNGRVTKPGRQRPRVPVDERLRAMRACQYIAQATIQSYAVYIVLTESRSGLPTEQEQMRSCEFHGQTMRPLPAQVSRLYLRAWGKREHRNIGVRAEPSFCGQSK